MQASGQRSVIFKLPMELPGPEHEIVEWAAVVARTHDLAIEAD